MNFVRLSIPETILISHFILFTVLREVEDINLDPAKEDLEPQSEPLGHVTSQRLNIASVELRSSGLTDAVRCDDPGVQ
ncbi:hypothetical protein GGU11DRAFT_752027 [Lentinula aff. detonsa]|nr:hypothetical protein GGU11DRAFT_752027 [Lentinula aff. detonsa]